MNEERTKRGLKAIFSADVKGYSRLMERDEPGTINQLKKCKQVMVKLIQKYNGRVVDSPGDNMLAEFSSVVDAVECSVAIQKDLKKLNEAFPPDSKMEFRIGVNLGDIIEDDERIFGEGVNVAARLEGLAEPGGICISRTAYDAIGNKLPLEYSFLGKHKVKNIEKPIRAYRVLIDIEPMKKTIDETASLNRMAYTLPDKPSIAVLSFDNLSGDPGQEYIADGITENITASLSKNPRMFVIARTSVMAYKGKPITVKQVSEELCVRYILEGSYQRAGHRIRITAQLIDAIKGYHLWAERYDRDMESFFDLLDEITKEIGTSLQVQLTHGSYGHYGSHTKNFEAWGYYTKALPLFFRSFVEGVKEYNVQARGLFEKAIKLDSNYVEAIVSLGWVYLGDVEWSASPQEDIKKAFEMAYKAGEINESDAGHHGLLSVLYTHQGDNNRALEEAALAIAKDPNYPTGHTTMWLALYNLGRFEDAIPTIETSMRLQGPYFSINHLEALAMAHNMIGNYDKAISIYKEYLDRCDTPIRVLLGHAGLAVTYIWIGDEDMAREQIAEVLRIDPKFTIRRLVKTAPGTWHLYVRGNKAAQNRIFDAMRKAGIPEGYCA